MERKLVFTGDGSHSLFVPEINEHYHSSFGALNESRHVFIEAGLHFLLAEKSTIHVLEIGFGTGLNALLTCLEAKNHNIGYTAIEAYPLSFDTIQKLNYPTLLKDENAGRVFRELHKSEWEQPCNITAQFVLTKKKVFLEEAEFCPQSFHLIYFDAFAPEVQPELWTGSIFQRLFGWLAPGGVLVTYSSKGAVKQNLRSAGFTIERLAGPPGKRHILRAKKV
jgi:tRNA U34 5-methylaminomethyl-2-thiouridine-forming methyltransferase MnmC